MLKRPFVGVFAVFLLLGCFLVMREKSMNRAEKQAVGQIEGVVFDIVEKTNTTQLHLKNCIFYEEAGGKTYRVGNILSYYSNNSYYSGDFHHSDNQKSSYQDRISNLQQKSSQIVGEQRAEIQIGNTIKMTGTLQSFEKTCNFGQFDEDFYYRSRGFQYKFYGKELKIEEAARDWLKESLRTLRQKLCAVYDRHLCEEEAGVIKAMVMGEKSGLWEETRTLYQQNGFGHALAISGLHLSILGMGFYKLLEKATSPKKLSCVLAIVFIWLYGLMTGFGISTNRAVIMLMLRFFASALGRTYDMATALAISGIVILAQQPMLCADCGFLLSFGAIVGIGLVEPILENALKDKREEEKGKLREGFQTFLKSLLASLSVQLVTTPVILYFYYELPAYGIFLNLIVIPLMSTLLGCAVLGGIAGICFPEISFASRFFLGSVHVILRLYEGLGEYTRKLPYSRMILGKPRLWQLVVYYSLLFLLLFILDRMYKPDSREKEQKRGQKTGAEGRAVLETIRKIWTGSENWVKRSLCMGWLAAAFLLMLPAEGFGLAAKGLEITFLDVGQGDCIFLNNKKGMTCLVDGGSSDESKVGAYRILPFLKAKGVKALDYVMVTHADSDHMNGILELLEDQKRGGIRIKYLLLPATKLIEENYEKLVMAAKENEIPILYIKAGDRLMDGALELLCLHPAKDFVTADVNSYSMVLQVKYGSFQALLTGDLGTAEEEMLLKQEVWQDISLLKVAHHGSKNSSSAAFLETVKPELAIISSGAGNRYGHPHKETLERLAEVGCRVWNTAECGQLTVNVDVAKKKMRVFVQSWKE